MKKPTGAANDVEARRERIAHMLAIGAVRAAAAAKARESEVGRDPQEPSPTTS